jgi:hypothetical protein
MFRSMITSIEWVLDFQKTHTYPLHTHPNLLMKNLHLGSSLKKKFLKCPDRSFPSKIKYPPNKMEYTMELLWLLTLTRHNRPSYYLTVFSYLQWRRLKIDTPMIWYRGLWYKGHVIPSFSHLQCPIWISWVMWVDFFFSSLGSI